MVNYLAPRSPPAANAESAASPAATAGPSASSAEPSASPSAPTPAAGTQVFFESSESPPDAQPDPSSVNPSPDVYPSPDVNPLSDHSEHVLDSQGLIKPDVVIIEDPSTDLPAKPSASSASCSRSSRRTPAPVPEALADAAHRRPTSPSIVSDHPRFPALSISPMETTSDLKRKSAQTDARERKKKGKK